MVNLGQLDYCMSHRYSHVNVSAIGVVSTFVSYELTSTDLLHLYYTSFQKTLPAWLCKQSKARINGYTAFDSAWIRQCRGYRYACLIVTGQGHQLSLPVPEKPSEWTRSSNSNKC